MTNIVIQKLNNILEILERDHLNNWMTLKQVIDYTMCSASTLHRVIRMNKLRVSKKTGKLLFRRQWVDEWLNG